MIRLALIAGFICLFAGCESVIFRVNVRHQHGTISIAGNRNCIGISADVLTDGR